MWCVIIQGAAASHLQQRLPIYIIVRWICVTATPSPVVLLLPLLLLYHVIVQVSDEGEIAMRLGLQVMAAPMPSRPHLHNPGSSSSSSRPGSSSRVGSSSSSSTLLAPELEHHAFDIGFHLNLSQLIGPPSLQTSSKLSAESDGPGTAAVGVLLIGDLGLEPEELAQNPWRCPALGAGVLPASPLLLLPPPPCCGGSNGAGGGDGSSSSSYSGSSDDELGGGVVVVPAASTAAPAVSAANCCCCCCCCCSGSTGISGESTRKVLYLDGVRSDGSSWCCFTYK